MKNHALIADQEFLDTVRTTPIYRLLNLGPYPGLILAETIGRAIHGELWHVDAETLARLDVLERVPTMYERRPVKIDSFPEDVQTYFFVGDACNAFDCGESWPPKK